MTCSVCGSPKYRSGILCGACRSRVARRRARKCAAEAGLCSDCLTRPRRPGRVLCSRCARLHSASHARRRADPEYLTIQPKNLEKTPAKKRAAPRKRRGFCSRSAKRKTPYCCAAGYLPAGAAERFGAPAAGTGFSRGKACRSSARSSVGNASTRAATARCRSPSVPTARRTRSASRRRRSRRRSCWRFRLSFSAASSTWIRVGLAIREAYPGGVGRRFDADHRVPGNWNSGHPRESAQDAPESTQGSGRPQLPGARRTPHWRERVERMFHLPILRPCRRNRRTSMSG